MKNSWKWPISFQRCKFQNQRDSRGASNKQRKLFRAGYNVLFNACRISSHCSIWLRRYDKIETSRATPKLQGKEMCTRMHIASNCYRILCIFLTSFGRVDDMENAVGFLNSSEAFWFISFISLLKSQRPFDIGSRLAHCRILNYGRMSDIGKCWQNFNAKERENWRTDRKKAEGVAASPDPWGSGH